MTRKTTPIAVLAALLVSAPLFAQPGPGVRGERAGARREAPDPIEHALSLREQLELNDQQVEQLEALRQEFVDHRTSRMEAMMNLRSRARAGDVPMEEVREAMRATRDQRGEVRAAHRERFEAILTDDQREEFQGARRRAMMNRQGDRGPRDGARPGRGGRRGPGGGNGLDGPSA